ncbi:hypothetical protein AC1031_003120 [Aphanomyces cochlioides]|nr:hypothetical protein AC1031_003120 [Aphanomyces cochlioides]
MRATTRPSSAPPSRLPTSPTAKSKRTSIPAPTTSTGSPRRSPTKSTLNSSPASSFTSPKANKTLSKQQSIKTTPPPPAPQSTTRATTDKAKPATPHYLKTTKASVVQSVAKSNATPTKATGGAPKKAQAVAAPSPIHLTVQDMQATLNEHISQQTSSLQRQLDDAVTRNGQLQLQLDDAVMARRELEDALEKKEAANADFAKACARYKADCESFAAKAIEWKQKYDAIASANKLLEQRKVAAAKSRAMEKRIQYLAQDVAHTAEAVGGTSMMDYKIHAVPEGDEDEANFERCESHLDALQKELKRLNERLKGMDADGFAKMEQALVDAKALAAAREGDLVDMKAKLMHLAKAHCAETDEALERVAELEAQRVEDTRAFDAERMTSEDWHGQLDRAEQTLTKLRFDKQLLAERFAALQTAQRETQARLDDHDETKARMKEKIKRLKDQLAEATAHNFSIENVETLDISVAHAALQEECVRLQETTEEQRQFAASQELVVGVLQEQLNLMIDTVQQLRDAASASERQPSSPKQKQQQQQQLGEMQRELYLAAIEAYAKEAQAKHEEVQALRAKVDDLAVENRELLEKMDDLEQQARGDREQLEEKIQAISNEKRELEAQVEEMQAKMDGIAMKNKDLNEQLASSRNNLAKVERKSATIDDDMLEIHAEKQTLHEALKQSTDEVAALKSQLEAQSATAADFKARLDATTKLTHDLAAQVKQFPSREEKLRVVIEQLQAQEAAADAKQTELDKTIATMEQTIQLLQSEAETSLEEIQQLLQTQRALEMQLATAKVENMSLQELVTMVQVGSTRLQTIMEQDKEELIDSYVEEVGRLEKRIDKLEKKAEEDAERMQTLAQERDEFERACRDAVHKCVEIDAAWKRAQESAASSEKRVHALEAELAAQVASLTRAVDDKTTVVCELQANAAALEAAVATLQAEKAQYKTEVHAIEAILHENSPLQKTVDVLEKSNAKQDKARSPNGASGKSKSPHAEIKQLRQRVKDVEMEKELLQAELEQAVATRASSKYKQDVALYAAQVEELEEKLAEQTAMYLASVKQAQQEYKELEGQYQAKIRHLEMELHLDEARIEALEGRLAEALSSRQSSAAATSPAHRRSRH